MQLFGYTGRTAIAVLIVYEEVSIMVTQEKIDAALALLPSDGSEIDFDAYKDSLYAAMPESGKEVFTYLLQRNMVKRRLELKARDNIKNLWLAKA